ncbi:MAG TPA: hypothetical protein VFK71_06725 [Gaiellaceae bacterium]|nr:hypothetical protein [Gaiellaceae bacterium]
MRGKLAFVRGVTGRAATIGGGRYFPEARVHTALLRTSIFNPEHGAVEAWYRQTKDPEPFVDNPHRILGGPYDLGSGDVSLYAQDANDSGDPRLHFVVFFGRNLPNPRYVEARSVADRQRGYPVSGLNGRWIHLAGVWDRKGIEGSNDTVRLYVNGAVVAVSHRDDWGTRTCSMRKEGCLSTSPDATTRAGAPSRSTSSRSGTTRRPLTRRNAEVRTPRLDRQTAGQIARLSRSSVETTTKLSHRIRRLNSGSSWPGASSSRPGSLRASS